MQILQASRLGDHPGPHHQILHTSQGTLQPRSRAITQTDSNAASTNGVFASLPANIAIQVTDLSRRALRQVNSNPSKHAEKANKRLLNRAARHLPDALRLSMGVAHQDVKLHEDDDAAWLTSDRDANTHASLLLPIKDDTPQSLRRRMLAAKETVTSFQPSQRKQVFAALRTDADDFSGLWGEITGRSEPLCLVELHGYRGAHDALELVRTTAAADVHAPVTMAVNGERYLRSGPKASGSLVVSHYGVQSFAPRVYPPFKAEPDPVKWWFSRPRGGYVDMTTAPDDFRTRCPADFQHPLATKPWMALGGEGLDLRRRDETWAHDEEMQVRAQAIAAGAYADYVGDRDLLDAGLVWMGEA